MKKIMAFAMSTLVALAGFAQNSFTVKAKINNPNHYTPFLGYAANGKFIADTNYTMEHGWYIFKGAVPGPVVASFGLRGNPALTIKTDRGFVPGPTLPFVLSNDVITIKGDAEKIFMASVKGGKANKEWNRIRKKENAITAQIWSLNKQYHEGSADSLTRNKNLALMTSLARKKNDLQKHFITRNPNSLVSAYFLSGMVNLMNTGELKTAYQHLGADAKNNSYAQRIAKKIEGMEATAVGREAVPISKKDRNGNLVNLETLKGKYVLLDFWGSWCHPCRQSHPHLKELYAKYKSRGFEILGIAQETRQTLDENRKAWLEAVEKDGINWLQVLNNEDVDKFDAVKAYGVSAFPTKILLDKDGTILARYVGEGGHELDKKLEELFGK